jgi:hypothetical protein
MDCAGSTHVNQERTKLLPVRTMPLVAAALFVISLGFPWTMQAGSLSTYIPGSYIPGFCHTTYGYDGWASTSCDPGTVTIGLYVPGSDGTVVSGRMHPARFGLVGGCLLIAMGLRNRQTKWFTAAAVFVAVLSFLTSGASIGTAGLSTALLGSMFAFLSGGLRRADVIPKLNRRLPSDLSTVSGG